METKNLDIYGSEPLLWSRVLDQLEQAKEKATYFLATTRPDGRPHLAGVGARWEDGKFYVVSGPGTRKSKNLAQNPNCSLAVSLEDIDLVVEGIATKVWTRRRSRGWPRTTPLPASRRRPRAPCSWLPTALPAPDRRPGTSTS
jgi:hypothetical protein